MNILITRPKKQAVRLSETLRARGHQTFIFPMVTIEPMPLSTTLLSIIKQAHRCDFLIFVSPNAVEHAWPLFQKEKWWPTHATLLAQGEGTARELKKRGVDAIWPKMSNSEGLLSLPCLQQLPKKTVLLVRGVGGRGMIAPTLAERQANVLEAIVYQRSRPKGEIHPHLAQWQKAGLDRIIITSQESLLHFFEWVGESHHAWLKAQVWVVISQRIADKAKQLGLHQVIISQGCSEASLIEAIF